MSRTEGGKLNPRMSLKKLVHCVSLQLIHIEKFSCFAWNTSLCVRNRCFSVQKIEICTVWKDFSPSYNGMGPPQRSLDVEVRPDKPVFTNCWFYYSMFREENMPLLYVPSSKFNSGK